MGPSLKFDFSKWDVVVASWVGIAEIWMGNMYYFILYIFWTRPGCELLESKFFALKVA